jgi:hypothetical protein
MTEEIGQQVVAQITKLLKEGKVIVFEKDIPDNQYPEILWSTYGLTQTNEIAVLVTCGSKTFAAKAKSRLIMPAMADRVLGIDTLDATHAFELGDKLWERFSDGLVQEVALLRKSQH